jgi:hypothetical protein
VWTNWNNGPTTATSNNYYIWTNWSDAGNGSASSNTVWYEWNNSHIEPVDYVSVTGIVPLTKEEKARIERENEERRKRVEEERKRFAEEREAAEVKANELLLDLIGPEQHKVYEETGRLFIKGQKYDYLLQKEGLVKRLEKDKVTDLCVHLRNKTAFPETDNVIALKLLAEADEEQFNRIANNHGSVDRKNYTLPKAACM